MRDELRRVWLFTSGLAELTRNRAEDLVRDLVRAGEVPRRQAEAVAHELLERARSNREELLRLLRSEVSAQVETLGVARRSELEALRARIDALEQELGDLRSDRAGAPAARKTTRKATRRKTTARGAPGDDRGPGEDRT